MSRFIEIQHDEWIAAPPDIVRDQYADLQHRLVARVHPHERLRLLEPGPTGPRFERIARSGWRVARDVYERQYKPDGSVVDACVAGTHWGRTTTARFWRRSDENRLGTLVELTVTQPLRPLVGALFARWARRCVEDELRRMIAEDKVAIERSYQARTDRSLRVA